MFTINHCSTAASMRTQLHVITQYCIFYEKLTQISTQMNKVFQQNCTENKPEARTQSGRRTLLQRYLPHVTVSYSLSVNYSMPDNNNSTNNSAVDQ